MMAIMQTKLCNYLSFLVFGLLTQCPLGKALASCPLDKLRKNDSLEEKFRLAKHLSESESEQVLAVHNACFLGRLQSCRAYLAQGLTPDAMGGKGHLGEAKTARKVQPLARGL